MYYSAGTYESFAHPEKPKDVDKKSAYIIGTGLAGLTAAFYLVRDGQMKGEHIHLLEKLELAGGSCDGRKDVTKGFYMRGGREMDNHFEVMWDMFRDVPSLENPEVSVLDEYYWLNKHDPNYSLCRASVNRGEDAHTDKKFGLDKESAMALSQLFITPEKALEGKKISEVLPDSFWSTNFWLYWQTMFAFQRWSSALEMKRYLCRYVHHIDGLPDFSALRFTKYNQYESLIMPLVKYLENHGVTIEYGMDVKNVIIDTVGDKKIARQIVFIKDGKEQTIDLVEDDLVFITNGCCTDTSCYGDQTHAPDLTKAKNGTGESWDLWKNIAKQAEHSEFGNPDNFCTNIEETNWMSATVATSNEEIIQHIINICKRDPREGKVTTGGIVTVKDSMDNWYLSWTINRQPQFKSQDKDTVLIWLYALSTNKEGNYVKKAMRDCTGEEVCREWLYHIGIPDAEIDELAKNACNTTTCFMPFINAFFQPRKNEDRPKVVPDGAVNFAFLGQFAETPRDTIFTIEYSMRTGMESVYTLLDVDRGVPEVWGSKYDVR
ncbi:MAG: oleate hydratase, partial [Oscillospiraceae bacterium]|nr:oleate hydratase [Oscillospiraceae bacterium]